MHLIELDLISKVYATPEIGDQLAGHVPCAFDTR